VNSFSTRDFGSFAPRGFVFDGTNYLVPDPGRAATVQMAPGGVSSSSFSTAAFGATNPLGVGISFDGANVAVADQATGRLYEVSLTGTVASSFSTRDFGSFTPRGSYSTAGATGVPDQARAAIVLQWLRGGIRNASFSDCFVRSDEPDRRGDRGERDERRRRGPGDGADLRVLATGTLVSSFSTRDFGSFSPRGFVFDGTNYRIPDQGERELFAVPPGRNRECLVFDGGVWRD